MKMKVFTVIARHRCTMRYEARSGHAAGLVGALIGALIIAGCAGRDSFGHRAGRRQCRSSGRTGKLGRERRYAAGFGPCDQVRTGPQARIYTPNVPIPQLAEVQRHRRRQSSRKLHLRALVADYKPDA